MDRTKRSDGRTRRQNTRTPVGIDDRLVVDAEELAIDFDRDGFPVTADIIRLAIRTALAEVRAIGNHA